MINIIIFRVNLVKDGNRAGPEKVKLESQWTKMRYQSQM